MSGTEVLSVPTNFSSKDVSFSTDSIQSRFTFGDEVGSGSSASVRVCTDNQNGQKFACKSISMSRARDASEMDNVHREIAVMDKLGCHPRLVRLQHVFENERTAHLVMELCEGGDLLDEVNKNGSIGEIGAAIIISQVATALNYCHENGIMHRDVKPENIFLTRSSGRVGVPEFGRLEKAIFDVKLGDFGLATFLGHSQEASGFVGSPFYVAPEILNQFYYGTEADIWSLGVVMHVLLSGEFPFSASSDAQLYSQISRAKVDLNGRPWPAISASAKSLLKAMLVRDPKARPTAKQILQHPWIQNNGYHYTRNWRESCFGKTDTSDLKDSFQLMENMFQPAPLKISRQLSSTSNISDSSVTESPVSVLGGISSERSSESYNSSSGMLKPQVSSCSEFRETTISDFPAEGVRYKCAGNIMGGLMTSYCDKVKLFSECWGEVMKASLEFTKTNWVSG